MEEKVINWKLMRSTENYYTRFFMYFELDLNITIIRKLIQDRYVYTYSALFAKHFGLNRCIPIRSLENYTRGYNYANKRIQLLASFRRNKYPSHQVVINYLHFSGATEKLDKKFLDNSINSITYLEGSLSFDEIETPKDINNFIDLILYIWKNA